MDRTDIRMCGMQVVEKIIVPDHIILSDPLEKIYVCSPYRGNVSQNIENTRKYCRFVLLQGKIPVAPHLMLPQFMSEKTEREEALAANLSFLEDCTELWAFVENEDCQVTEGMAYEISHANKVRYVTCSPAIREMIHLPEE